VPLSFLPLDGLADTRLNLFVAACAFDAAGENNEQLPDGASWPPASSADVKARLTRTPIR
jgi:hypothetical protein